MAIIAYHGDSYDVGNAYNARIQYYGDATATPRVKFDGVFENNDGLAYGSMYRQYIPYYNQAFAVPLDMDMSLSLVSSDQVRVDISNISSKRLSGKLHIVLVERYRPCQWMDMNIADFVARAMIPSVEGQAMTLEPGAKTASTQTFFVQPDWNYCWIMAFFQDQERRILQGALIPIESTIPKIQITEPAPESVWLQQSTHLVSWAMDRPLDPKWGEIEIDYSKDGGKTWTAIQLGHSGVGEFSWKVPPDTSSECLLAAFDLYGEARTVSKPFTIAAKGDFTLDAAVNAADRKLLVDYLLENRGRVLPGADLNEDGLVDILDLIYFDKNLIH